MPEWQCALCGSHSEWSLSSKLSSWVQLGPPQLPLHTMTNVSTLLGCHPCKPPRLPSLQMIGTCRSACCCLLYTYPYLVRVQVLLWYPPHSSPLSLAQSCPRHWSHTTPAGLCVPLSCPSPQALRHCRPVYAFGPRRDLIDDSTQHQLSVSVTVGLSHLSWPAVMAIATTHIDKQLLHTSCRN